MHSDERTPKNGRPISKCRQAKVSEMAVNNLLAAQQVMNSINNDCDLMSFNPATNSQKCEEHRLASWA